MPNDTDDAIRERIKDALRRNGFSEPAHRVAVSVREGVVRLTGSVPYEDEIGAAGAVVAKIAGDRAITNRLLYREGRPEPVAS